MQDSLLVSLLNLISGIILIYCIVAVPISIFIRIKRSLSGEYVSPIGSVIKRVLKNWLISALILIPTSSVITYITLSNNGVNSSDIATFIVMYSMIGNILTSLMFGIAYTIYSKG